MTSNRLPKIQVSYLHFGVLAVLALIALLIYSNTLHVPFQFDDRHSIVRNKSVHLTELSWTALAEAAFGRQVNRPLTNLTFALNHYWNGLDVQGYHAFNIIVHIISGMLLYGWIFQTLRLPVFRPAYSAVSACRMAAICSLLWVVHPVNTQAVTYIVQRATGLATLFYLGTLLCYTKMWTGSIRKRWLWGGLAATSALLALGSKEIAIMLPITLIFYDIFFIRQLKSDLIRQRLPLYLALMSGLALLAVFKFYTVGTGLFTNYHHPQDFTMGERLLTEGRVLVHYLSLLVFPHPSRLSVDYHFPISHSIVEPISTLFAWVFLIGVLGIALGVMKRMPLISFCILWFFLNLALESTVIMLDIAFEHRLYLPSIGILLLAAAGIEHGILKIPLNGLLLKRLAWSGVLGILVVFSYWTWERNWVWNDNLGLWQDALNKHPKSGRAHSMLAQEYMHTGQIESALEEYKAAVEEWPPYKLRLIKTLANWAKHFHEKGESENAHRVLSHVLGSFPEEALSHYYMGTLLVEEGKPQPAVEHLERAINMDPKDGDFYNNLGMAYLKMQRFDEALNAFGKAIALKPHYKDVYNRLGDQYRHQKAFDQAALFYKAALQARPRSAATLYKLAMIYHSTEKPWMAIEVLKEAVEPRPEYSQAYNLLGVSYGKVGLLDEAVAVLNEAIRLNPNNRQAHLNLSRTYKLKGLDELANRHLQESREGFR